MAQIPNDRALIIHPDNPFKADIERFKGVMRPSSRSTPQTGYKHRKITIIEETEYFPGSFTKIYQNKEVLRHLSPDACKILIHIACELTWNDQKMEIRAEQVGLERRRFGKAIMELLTERIVLKEKPHWYWVNITLLIVGHIAKDDAQS